MDWSAIAAIAELVAAVGVIASLLYLGIQVRHNTRVARIRAEEAALTALREVTRTLVQYPDVSRAFRAGLEDWDSLDADERARFMHIAFQTFKSFETMHSSYMNGIMREDTWTGWRQLMVHYLASSGMRRYWQMRREVFSSRFQRFVDGLPEPETRLTVATAPGAEPRPEAGGGSGE